MKKQLFDTVSQSSLHKKDPLRTAAVIYLALPLLAFYCGFLRGYWAVLCGAALIVVICCMLKKADPAAEMQESQLFSGKTVLPVFFFTLLWTYLGGMNGYFFQTSDWDCRNAIYFDLIQYPWPVIYPQSGGALVYYIGHWLPPAALARGILKLTGSAEAGLFTGRMLLWLWSSIGLTITILMLFRLLKAADTKKKVMAVLLFMFFSGLDILGAICEQKTGYLLQPRILHLEWWGEYYQYSSMTTCVFWVFNQSIIPWMLTACFLMEDGPENYIFYCVACLLTGPLPCVGLVILMLVKAAVYLIGKAREKQIGNAMKAVFSVRNLISLFVLFPPVALYILSNNSIGGSSASFGGASTYQVTLGTYFNYALFEFLLFDVGLYLLFVFPDCKKDPLFYTIAISFLLIPYFHVGTSNDFCMRASIPGIFTLMFFVSRFLLEHFRVPAKRAFVVKDEKEKIRRICAWMLAICFIIGAVTPAVEIYRGFYHVAESGTFFLEDQSIMTFNGETTPYNFGCDSPNDHLFFRYFAKK